MNLTRRHLGAEAVGIENSDSSVLIDAVSILSVMLGEAKYLYFIGLLA
ncbi:MAG: hypothetical protein QGG73_14010 [Candidatus Hydrogenedentes bacterium]|jgi:hypothetical protein|nr:hypothetical protein [Candidatus Hydrogenedentota bacterium]